MISIKFITGAYIIMNGSVNNWLDWVLLSSIEKHFPKKKLFGRPFRNYKKKKSL